MANSIITKNAIASSFKRLLEVTPFGKITVSAIAAECGINRQTFYYHFHDIYDLVGWIIDDEMNASFDSQQGNPWETLTALLFSLQNERIYFMYGMRSADPVIMYHLLKDRLTTFVTRAMSLEVPEPDALSPEERLSLDFCAGGLAEVILSWLEGGCTTPPPTLVSQLEHMFTETLPQLATLSTNRDLRRTRHKAH